MADDQQQQPEVKTPAAKKGGGAFSAILPWLIAFSPQITAVLVFVIFLAVVFAIIRSQQTLQPPNMSGQAGGTNCSSWTSAPPTYQLTFTNAANAYKISPALVGAIFLSEHGGKWASAPWATSPAGASGPFQFMPATWDSNQVDGDKDGKKDVQNFADASFGASRLLQAHISNYANKNWLTTDEKDIKTVAACYNWGCGGNNINEIKKYLAGDSSANVPIETKNYMDKIWTYFQNLNKGCTSASAYGASGKNQYSSLAEVERLFGSSEKAVQSSLVSTQFFGRSIRVNKVTVTSLKNIESQYKPTGSGFSIKSIGAYSWRANINSKSRLSAHSFGLAIDINGADYLKLNKARPASSSERDPNACKGDLSDNEWLGLSNLAKVFENNGFFWGAKYKGICDPMHFQYGGNWQ